VLYRADHEGNTPLHVAIDKGNFVFAESLINFVINARINDQAKILSIPNKKGISPGDMIGDSHLPRQVSLFFLIIGDLCDQYYSCPKG